VNIAYRSSEFEKPVLREYKGVPAALGHITDPTIGSGRRCARVTPESPIRENTGYGLLNWSERFGQVSVATVYSKTHWTKRVLSPTELLSALDAPALISKRASDSQKREWSQELNVPCKVRAEVMNLVCQILNPTERRVSERDGLPEVSPGNSLDLLARKRARVSFNLDGELSIADAGGRKNPQIDLEGNLMPSENKGSESEAKESCNEKEADETEKYRRREKACKSDDAAVPVYLWNDRVKAGLDYRILHNVSDPMRNSGLLLIQSEVFYFGIGNERLFGISTRGGKTNVSKTRKLELSPTHDRLRQERQLFHTPTPRRGGIGTGDLLFSFGDGQRSFR
jgi:hypothetical protein